MLLSNADFQKIVHGALTVSETDGAFTFSRLTEQQIAYYDRKGGLWSVKARATAGLTLDFYTDASVFTFEFIAEAGSSRTYWFIDGMIDGVPTVHIGNENATSPESGAFTINIPEGEHRVTVCFTGISRFTVKTPHLSGGTILREIKRKKTVLIHGDSITQGYDAYHPSMHYAFRLLEALEAEGLNQAIGGEMFTTEMLPNDLKSAVSPDLITVAYGTNDWFFHPFERFESDANAYFERLRELFPSVPVLCFLPIWRGDTEKIDLALHGTFDDMRAALASIAKRHGARVIDTIGFVPHLAECFWDGFLHPNDLGFLSYGDAAISAVRAHHNT